MNGIHLIPFHFLTFSLIGMVLSFPSIMDSLCYESNGGSGMHGLCVFLSFLLCVNIVFWVLCDYCEILAFASKVMGVHWLFIGHLGFL